MSANTLQNYLQLAKAKPGALTYAAFGPGSITQLLGEWITLKSGTNILDVPYKSVGAEMPDLLAGQIITGYRVATVIMAQVKSAKLRGLAGVEASAWSGYFVPAGVPQLVLQRLNRERVRVFNSTEVRELATSTVTEVIGGRPDEFAAFMRSEIVKWGGIIKEAGIKPR